MAASLGKRPTTLVTPVLLGEVEERQHVACGHLAQQIAREVHPAPLPGAALEHPTDCCRQPQVGIGDHQSGASQATPYRCAASGWSTPWQVPTFHTEACDGLMSPAAEGLREAVYRLAHGP